MSDAKKADLIERMNKLKWVHAIDLGDGVVTPGCWGKGNPTNLIAFDDIDFRGKKVLDIGCWDGLYSFEAEKRGASEVYATDLISQRSYMLPTFELAREALGSKVKHFPHVSVYDVEKELGVRDFDIVIYCGVYYHLKDPLRSICSLRRVMKEGGTLLIEGAIIDLGHVPPPATPHVGPRKSSHDVFARFYYREQFRGEDSNWWVPTIPCLREWVECNYFEIIKEYEPWAVGLENTRFALTAKAVVKKDPRYLRDDPDLYEYDPSMKPTSKPVY